MPLNSHRRYDYDDTDGDEGSEERMFLPLEIGDMDDDDEEYRFHDAADVSRGPSNGFTIGDDDDVNDDYNDNVEEEYGHPRRRHDFDDSRSQRSHYSTSSSLSGIASATFSPIMNLIQSHEETSVRSSRSGKYRHVRSSMTGVDESEREDTELDGGDFFSSSNHILSLSETMSLQSEHCHSIMCLVGVLLFVLLGAIVFVPRAERHVNLYGKTCRAHLFPDTHSWMDFSAEVEKFDMEVEENDPDVNKTIDRDPWLMPCFSLTIPNPDDNSTNATSIVVPHPEWHCKCSDRTQPAESDPRDSIQWGYARKHNDHLVEKIPDQKDENAPTMDVLLFGDEKVERFAGAYFGIAEPGLEENKRIFATYFASPSDGQSNKESKLTGLPLGVSHDECPQLLYRLKNGLLADAKARPRIWWVVAGNDDAIFQACSHSHILAGIIDITNTILENRPQTTVVLNSVFPVDTHHTMDWMYSEVQMGNNYWSTVIEPLNKGLECFAASHYDGRVRYFDGSPLFLAEEEDGAETEDGVPCVGCVNQLYFEEYKEGKMARVKLNSKGYDVWGNAIADYINHMYDE